MSDNNNDEPIIFPADDEPERLRHHQGTSPVDNHQPVSVPFDLYSYVLSSSKIKTPFNPITTFTYDSSGNLLETR